MISTALDDILGSRAKVSVLRALFKEDGINGRELGRRAGLSARAAHVALSQLAEAGVVDERRVGRSHQFFLNRRRRLVSRIAALFAEESSAPARIGDAIGGILGPKACLSAAVFGSVARGEGTARSDLDLLVVVRGPSAALKARRRLEEAADGLMDEFGVRVSPYVVDAGEFSARFRKGDKLIRTMVREARVILGNPLGLVAVGEA